MKILEKLKEILKKIKPKLTKKAIIISSSVFGGAVLLTALLIATFSFHIWGNHDWVNATCTEAKVCKGCHKTEGEPLGHDWIEADCENPKTCKICGETEGEPIGHKWENAACEKPKTCALCGETEGKALEHKWKEATCEKPKTCELCGKTEGKAKGHKYDNSKICTKDTKCEVCGKKIPAAGHKWTNATCTEPKKCSVCGKTEGEALGHTTSNGKCSRCGEEIELKVLMYSDSNLDIYYTGLSEGGLNDARINFYAVNKSSKSWTIQVRDESVNGSMMDFICSSDVAAGKNINDDMSCSFTYLNEIGVYSLDDIKSIEFYLHIYDDNHDDYDTGVISIDAKNNTVNKGASNVNANSDSNISAGEKKTIQEVEEYFNGLCSDIEKENNEDAMIVSYEMKSDYYQIGYFVPNLEWLYHNDFYRYNTFISQCQELSKSFKDYLDACGFDNYHAYVDIGADPPSGSGENTPEQVLVIEIRDGEIKIDASEQYYN